MSRVWREQKKQSVSRETPCLRASETVRSFLPTCVPSTENHETRNMGPWKKARTRISQLFPRPLCSCGSRLPSVPALEQTEEVGVVFLLLLSPSTLLQSYEPPPLGSFQVPRTDNRDPVHEPSNRSRRRTFCRPLLFTFARPFTRKSFLTNGHAHRNKNRP